MLSVIATRVAEERGLGSQVTRIASFAELQGLSSDWELLAGSSSPDNFFVSWDFVSSWWQAYGKGRELFVLVCRNAQGSIGAIAPLYRETNTGRAGLQTKTVRLIGDGSDDADGFGFLVQKADEAECVKAILDWLASHGTEWDLLEFNCMPEECAVVPELLRQINLRDWVRRSRPSTHLTVELPETWEEFLRGLTAKVRQTWLRKIRNAEKQHAVRLRRTRFISELNIDLETAFDLHNKSWRAKGTQGKLETEERREFYRLLCDAALKEGELDLWLLEVDGVARAARLGFLCGKKRYAMLAGMDPEFAQLSLGTVVEALVLKECILRGDATYDFLAGDEGYKLECHPRRRRYLNLAIARGRTRVGIQLSAESSIRAGKNWLRNELPSTREFLRKLLPQSTVAVKEPLPHENDQTNLSLRLQVVRDLREFGALQRDWNTLSATDPSQSIFLSWHWMLSWLEAYGPRALYTLVGHSANGDCVGIAPLYLSKWPGHNRRALRVLRLIGDETHDSGQLGFVTKRGGGSAFVRTIVNWLSSHRAEWDALEMHCLTPDETLAALLNEIVRHRWAVREREDSHMVIHLPGTMEQFRPRLSRGLVKSLEMSKKLLASCDVRFHRCSQPPDADAALKQLFLLHTLRWERREDAGAFADHRRRDFYERLTSSMLESGQLDLWTMNIDGKTVAAEFGLVSGTTRVSMQSGFDPDFWRLHIGALLDERIIEESIRRGVCSYDLMEGEQEYKKRWGAKRQELVSVRCAPPRSMGAAWVSVSGSKTAQKLWRKIKRGSTSVITDVSFGG